MKLFYMISSVMLLAGLKSYGQNTFPATGNVGIGTNTALLGTLNIAKASSYNIENTAGVVVTTGVNAQPELLFGTDNASMVSYIQSLSRLTNYSNVPLSLQPNGGNVVIGATTPTTINSSSGLFPGVAPKQEIVTGSAAAMPYSELLTIRHTGVSPDAFSRQLGLIFKLSNESSLVESAKMGGMLLESSNGYANYPTLSLVTNNTRRLTIDYSNGNVGIGITAPQNKLDVNGRVHAQSVLIDMLGWPDYVFRKEYQLPPLQDVKAYIDKNQHLPEIPSEDQIAKEGLNVGEMNKLLMKKVEELTLYLIEKDQNETKQTKTIEALELGLKRQQQQVDRLKAQIKSSIKH